MKELNEKLPVKCCIRNGSSSSRRQFPPGIRGLDYPENERECKFQQQCRGGQPIDREWSTC